MDPLTLATAAVTAISPLLKRLAERATDRAGELAGEAVGPAVRSLFDRIRSRLSPGTYGGALLDGLTERPEDPVRRQNVVTALAELLDREPAFAAELGRLVADAHSSGGTHVGATDAGAVAGRDIRQEGHYVAGRDLVIGRDPADPSA